MLLACLFKADAVDFMSFSAFAKGTAATPDGTAGLTKIYNSLSASDTALLCPPKMLAASSRRHTPPELLIEIVTEFMEIVNERFGSHVHILNWALHLDESTHRQGPAREVDEFRKEKKYSGAPPSV